MVTSSSGGVDPDSWAAREIEIDGFEVTTDPRGMGIPTRWAWRRQRRNWLPSTPSLASSWSATAITAPSAMVATGRLLPGVILTGWPLRAEEAHRILCDNGVAVVGLAAAETHLTCQSHRAWHQVDRSLRLLHHLRWPRAGRHRPRVCLLAGYHELGCTWHSEATMAQWLMRSPTFPSLRMSPGALIAMTNSDSSLAMGTVAVGKR